MHLEEQNLDIIMANSELLVACYYIVESAVSYLSNPENALSGILKQSRKIQQALNNAFAAILKFLHELSTNVLPNDPKKLEEAQMKYFVCATIRILGAWLSEESQALRDEVYDILPFILQLGSDTFEAQKLTKLGALPGRGSNDLSNFTPESALTILQKHGKQRKSNFCFHEKKNFYYLRNILKHFRNTIKYTRYLTFSHSWDVSFSG